MTTLLANRAAPVAAGSRSRSSSASRCCSWRSPPTRSSATRRTGSASRFRPIQGALDIGRRRRRVDRLAPIGEIDALRVDNSSLRAENDRLAAENARLEEISRENDQLTALLQLRAGFDYETVAARVIARESSEFRRMIALDKGTRRRDQPSAMSSIAPGGALAGRVTDVGPDVRDGRPAHATATSTVIGQLATSAATGEVDGQLGGVLVMTQIDSSGRDRPRRGGRHRRDRAGGGVRSPYPKGLLIGQVVDVQRDANDVVQTAYLHPAGEPGLVSSTSSSSSTTRAACRPSRSSRSTVPARTGRCPRASSPATRPRLPRRPRRRRPRSPPPGRRDRPEARPERPPRGRPPRGRAPRGRPPAGPLLLRSRP